jgi:hypothetical protein
MQDGLNRSRTNALARPGKRAAGAVRVAVARIAGASFHDPH